MWTRRDLKEKAKAAFKANYWVCVGVALILTVIVGVGSALGGSSISSSIPNTQSTAPVNQMTDFSNGTLNVNGTEFDLKSMDGNGIKDALAAVSEGLSSGTLNINGQTIDVTDKAQVAKIQEAIQSVQNSNLGDYSHDDITNGLTAMLMAIGGVILAFMIIASLITIFIINPLFVGLNGFFMVNEREKAKFGEIKRGFSPRWMHVVGTMLLQEIFLCLWSMLFLIPAIIKTYSYRMVPYILADNPEMRATETITLSRKMMKGNKWRAFVLDLSFIGWKLLDCLTFGILGIFYVNPYIFSTNAELYNTLKDINESKAVNN